MRVLAPARSRPSLYARLPRRAGATRCAPSATPRPRPGDRGRCTCPRHGLRASRRRPRARRRPLRRPDRLHQPGIASRSSCRSSSCSSSWSAAPAACRPAGRRRSSSCCCRSSFLSSPNTASSSSALLLLSCCGSRPPASSARSPSLLARARPPAARRTGNLTALPRGDKAPGAACGRRPRGRLRRRPRGDQCRLRRRARPHHQRHRPERRRQDDGAQSPRRLLSPAGGPCVWATRDIPERRRISREPASPAPTRRRSSSTR